MTEPGTALAVTGLGKRYRRGWALRECSFALPAGRICAVVGPNGAGKSTLLAMAAGLLAPSAGTLERAAERVAYVPQDRSLYPRFTVADVLRLGRELNPAWDQAKAEQVLASGGFPTSARIGSLSGGQRTRVSLALALGKRPDLLLLDEPMADLDPLARHELMGLLLAEAGEQGTTVVMSSHVIAELAESCDFLVLLSGGRVQLAGDVEELLALHRIVVGPADAAGTLADHLVVARRESGRQLTALLRTGAPVPPPWQATAPNLEELVLEHLRAQGAPPLLTDEARVAELVEVGG
ncbi:ABC transporter ATP-binding protein [Kitasatospora viridis]|uniref:ABC-2 type transport system ATP-binding protein n=1 Tax=Kitasatospora viridis TaxID=281105 RepID=A0A561TV41_9ACTN|nr:ABC transporter ATP-binding protein [Kitasatospora viridis]TWF90974.1 ABC-2 type transport system ATP-binding protein [Kitasatospora viridis]